jgi:hypothetical protein
LDYLEVLLQRGWLYDVTKLLDDNHDWSKDKDLKAVAYVKRLSYTRLGKNQITDRRNNDTLTFSKIEPGTFRIQFHRITIANVTPKNSNQLS